MPRRISCLLIARILAAVFIVAAGLKVYGLRAHPIAAGNFWSPAFQVALVEFEIVLALWLWSGARIVLAWLVALITFVAFSCASFYLAWIGQTSCGCLGASIAVNPWYTLTFDLVVVLALIWGRPELTCVWQDPGHLLRNAVLPVLGMMVGITAVFGIFFGLAHFALGSIPASLAYLRGERISVEPRVLDLGEGKVAEERMVTVNVTNWTDKPIRIVGARRECDLAVNDLPLSIPPGEDRPVSLSFRFSGKPGFFAHKAQLLVHDNGLQRVTVRLKGRILDKPSGANNQD